LRWPGSGPSSPLWRPSSAANRYPVLFISIRALCDAFVDDDAVSRPAVEHNTRRAYDTSAIRPEPRQSVDYAAAKTSRPLCGRSVTSVGVRARASGRSLLFTATARRQRGRGKGYFLLLLLLLRNRRGRVDRLRSLKLRRRRRLRSVGARRSGTPTVAPPHPPRLTS